MLSTPKIRSRSGALEGVTPKIVRHIINPEPT